MSDTHLLDDIEYHYKQASGNQRFVNYLVDRVFFYLCIRVINMIPGYPLYRLVYSMSGDNQVLMTLNSWLAIFAIFVLYTTALEASTGGKTLGKFLTRTRAVNADGTRITFKTALLRSLCRIIPFNQFSAFGKPCYPWHDRLTKTLVVDEKLTTLPPWD